MREVYVVNACESFISKKEIMRVFNLPLDFSNYFTSWFTSRLSLRITKIFRNKLLHSLFNCMQNYHDFD